MSTPSMSRGEAARWACILEVCAPKAGNVHPGASFADTTWRDFVRSAEAIAPILNEAPRRGVGQTVLDCVKATRQAVGKNTNLGIILLLAPLCAVKDGTPLNEGIKDVLRSLTVCDAELTYDAIRIAKPGGLGHADTQDASQRPTQTLREVMALAADRDDIAAQYVTDFREVFRLASLYFHDLPEDGAMRIVQTHLYLLARNIDTLIARKCGWVVAHDAQDRAQQTILSYYPKGPITRESYGDFDAWLRADGNRRNPGTSADLIAAALYVCLREGTIRPPFPWVNRILESL